jgi:hypothetical protein
MRALGVARIEPPGRTFGAPEDQLREIRDFCIRKMQAPHFALLNAGYISQAAYDP